MRLMISILIGSIFLLIAFLNNNGLLNIGFIGMFETADHKGGVDFSFLPGLASMFAIVPDILFSESRDFIMNFISNNLGRYAGYLSEQNIYYVITFLFYFIFSLITITSSKFFTEGRDRLFINAMVAFLYILILQSIQKGIFL